MHRQRNGCSGVQMSKVLVKGPRVQSKDLPALDNLALVFAGNFFRTRKGQADEQWMAAL